MSKRIQGFYESFEVFPTARQILRRLYRRWESQWRARRKGLPHEALSEDSRGPGERNAVTVHVES